MTKILYATGRRPDGAAFIIAAVLAALGGLLIWQGRAIPDKGGYAGIGSGDLPVFIGAGLVLLAAGHVVKGLRHAAPPLPRQQPVPILLIVGGLLLQLILLKPLGFSIASGLLFACTAAAFGKTRVVLTLPVGIVFALIVYGVFDRLLQLNLPAGLPETLIFGG
ncbi:MAG: tripartite tricarboxylate transporter TctB family protein [Tabrizicola sp.]|uniref:tripartite tricarboxylate transporter TctB family protein n=1 Tax=Tabrizicola sp. TaxID=2005166 RepID=UPI002735C5CE|nr:tripartite tricarboxylate transporter TctB family protein [Tabrizicola sp.]MDP3264073.1 tripartite tricarboxylate transporter TctB family protein [Tabrizicola sp.]MDP3649401.1 tripartite tricarboxylate transporter TctB family protein [Paracoccaceae bacterium]MDZ4086896.1 tripartite tricarboxylate transporter TctB family protein [Tabrizicola sp.]